MSLSGDFRTMDLADVLEWIANRYKTGTLTVERRTTRKGLVFRDGVLRASRSNDPRETLGQYLVRDGLISEEHLFETLLRQEKEQRLLGVMLVEDGRVAPEDITRVLREALAESVCDVFLWGEGRFELADDAPPAEMPFEVSLEVATLIHEGQRRRVQWDRVRALASPRTRFRALVGVEKVADPKEGDVFILAAAGKTLGEIALRRRRPEFETACLLHSFCERKLLAVENPGETESVTDTITAIAELQQTAARSLDDGHYDAAFDAFEKILGLDRLNQDAKKGLLAVAEARRSTRVAQRVQMEAIPVLLLSPTELTRLPFNPQEGFLLSRINGQWNVQNLLKVCPLPEENVIDILARLFDRNVIEFK
jgi:uncharacterized protein DUF4388